GMDAGLDLAVGAPRRGEQLQGVTHFAPVGEVLWIEIAHALPEDLRGRARQPERDADQDGELVRCVGGVDVVAWIRLRVPELLRLRQSGVEPFSRRHSRED